MKKIFTLLILSATLSLAGYSQLPTADVRVENPRIIGSSIYFDIYFQRTNDNIGWNMFGFDVLNKCSWYFRCNITDLTNFQVQYDSPILFPPGSPGNYTHTTGTTTIGGIDYMYINTAFATNQFVFIDLGLNTWYHAFTISGDITGNASNLSGLSWDVINTGLTAGGTSTSIWPIGYIDSGCGVALNTKSWTGAVSSDWDNASNWSPTGVPSGVDIIYPNFPLPSGSPYTYNPLGGMSISTFGLVQNLRVNHFAEMTIPQSTGLTVTSNVTLMGGPRNIICASGNNVGTLSSAFIPEGTIDYSGYSFEDGHIEVHRTLYYTGTTTSAYMHQVAAPVSGVILDDWDMLHDSTYAYEWRTATQTWWNIYAPSRLTPSGYGFVLSLYGVNGISTEDVVFMDNLVLNDLTVTFDAIQFDENALIGNPYTAPIDWSAMMTPAQPNIGANCYLWDPATKNYVVHNGATGNLSARYIQPGQAFFIEATGNATQFTITRADRVQNIQPYMKNMVPYVLKLSTEGGNESSDEVYVSFMEGDDITTAYDINHDARDWQSYFPSFATELYTVSSDEVDLAIDTRPMLLGDEVSVPLHFKPTVDAEYNIIADEESMSSFPPSISIMLEDTFEPQLDWIDLRMEGSYTFDALKWAPRDRFVLHFYDIAFGIDDELAYQPIKIYSDRTDAFIINDSEQLIKEINVYDISGNLMVSRTTVNAAHTRIFVSDHSGYYVIKVVTDKAVYTEKVLITK